MNTPASDAHPSLGAQLEEALQRQWALSAIFDRIQKPRAQARSTMAADSQATSPIQIEHLVSYCLLQATDCGRALTRAVRAPDGTVELPIMALYPLVRGQIECAAVAAWIMTPVRRRERVLRRLQIGHDEVAKEKALAATAFRGRTDSESQRVRRAESQRERRRKTHLRAVAAANGIEPAEYENTWPGWEAVISDAGHALGLPNDSLVVVWRLASGLSHPSLTRGTTALEFTTVSEDGNVLSGMMSTRAEWVTTAISYGARVTEVALEHWRALKVRPNAERTLRS